MLIGTLAFAAAAQETPKPREITRPTIRGGWQPTCVANRDPHHVLENFGTLIFTK